MQAKYQQTTPRETLRRLEFDPVSSELEVYLMLQLQAAPPEGLTPQDVDSFFSNPNVTTDVRGLERILRDYAIAIERSTQRALDDMDRGEAPRTALERGALGVVPAWFSYLEAAIHTSAVPPMDELRQHIRQRQLELFERLDPPVEGLVEDVEYVFESFAAIATLIARVRPEGRQFPLVTPQFVLRATRPPLAISIGMRLLERLALSAPHRSELASRLAEALVDIASDHYEYTKAYLGFAEAVPPIEGTEAPGSPSYDPPPSASVFEDCFDRLSQQP